MKTADEVEALNKMQKDPTRHPYTCGNNSLHQDLVATADGWICLDCDYKQSYYDESQMIKSYLKVQRIKDQL